MKVRIAKQEDLKQIEELLNSNGVQTPKEVTDMGLCLVIEGHEGLILGTVSITMGNTTSAYVDYWAVREGNKKAAYELIKHMETILRVNGIRRYRMVCADEKEHANDLFESWGAMYGGNVRYYYKEL